MGNNLFVGVHFCIVIDDLLDGTSIVRPSIFWIAIILHDCLLAKRLWKVLLASSILHTALWRAVMDHISGDCIIQLRMCNWIWYLSKYECINLLNGQNFVFIFQKDKKMHVRKPMLLIFDGVHQSDHRSIIAFLDLLKQSLLLLIEYTGYQVRSISC